MQFSTESPHRCLNMANMLVIESTAASVLVVYPVGDFRTLLNKGKWASVMAARCVVVKWIAEAYIKHITTHMWSLKSLHGLLHSCPIHQLSQTNIKDIGCLDNLIVRVPQHGKPHTLLTGETCTVLLLFPFTRTPSSFLLALTQRRTDSIQCTC